MSWYDTAQVCLNGHVVNDAVRSSPESNQKYCERCGAATITACEKCKQSIPGYYHSDTVVVIGGRTMDAPPHCANCGAPYPWTDRQNKISARAKRAAIGIGKKISVAYAEFLARVVDTSLGQTAIAIMLAAAALLLPSKITLVVAMVVAGLLLLRSAYRPGRLLRTLIVIGLALIFVSVVVWRNRELHTVPRPPATVLPSEKSSDEKDAAKTDVAKTETPKTEAKDVNKGDDTQAPPKRSQPKIPKMSGQEKTPTEKQIRPQTQINNAPNGIAIGGGTVNNPTVNNIAIPRARIRGSSQSQKQVGDNWVTEFAISSTDIVPIGIIRLTCDEAILGGDVSSSSAITGIRHVGLDPSDPTTLVIDLTAPESISPSHPIAVHISAKRPVQIVSGTVGGTKIELPIANPVAVSAQQPTFSVTNPTGSIINQGSRVDAPQTINNNFVPPQRRLRQDQRAILVDCLKRGSGTEVFSIFAQHNIEAQTYSDEFGSALKDAGWIVKPYTVPFTENRQGIGIQVWVSDGNNPPLSAKVLFGCLEYLKLKPYGVPNKDLIMPNEVLLYVGAAEPTP